jgi:hypothetical protein
MSAIPKPAPREKRAPRPIKRTAIKARKCGLYAHECGQTDEKGPCVRKRIRKASKNPLPRARKAFWEKFRDYIKARDGNTCFSCGKAGLEGSGWHAGHMFPSGNNSILRYHPKNVHSQCFFCNLNMGGNGAAYASRFIDTYGIEEFRRLDGMRGRERKWTVVELREMGEALDRGGADFECLYAEKYDFVVAPNAESPRF